MRRLPMAVAVAVAVALFPATSSAKSIHTAECEAVCANPDPSVDQNLSPDPRSFATIANGYTNYWQECHAETDEVQKPKTCREWCAARERGRSLLETSGLIGSFLDAATYNSLWRAWGALERPPDFDQHIVERYGLQPAPFPNPYPLPGEDPATANGGSGQLPMGLIQTRNSSRQYDGGIGFTCLLCHAGRIGDATPERSDLGSRIGIGNTTFDIDVFSYDLGKAGGVPIPLPYPHNQGRGTINAVSDFEFLMTLRDFDTLDSTPFVKAFPAHASPGDQDPPAWHNTGSRPRVYMDGGVSADNTRALMQFLTASITTSTCADANAANTPGCGAWIKRQERDFEDIRTLIESIEPPAFPSVRRRCRGRARRAALPLQEPLRPRPERRRRELRAGDCGAEGERGPVRQRQLLELPRRLQPDVREPPARPEHDRRRRSDRAARLRSHRSGTRRCARARASLGL